MDAAFLDLIHRYGFVLLAVVGACWIAARVGLLVLNALLWLAECMAADEEITHVNQRRK